MTSLLNAWGKFVKLVGSAHASSTANRVEWRGEVLKCCIPRVTEGRDERDTNWEKKIRERRNGIKRF
jgi:hypothetical protein